MICEKYAKNFCCEDLSLIENYDKAIADMTQTWHCHHRGEISPCGRFSVSDLKKFELYFNRPASELIFLTHSEHRRLHLKGVPLSEDHKKAISDSKKGVPTGPMSEDHKKAISDAKKGVPLSEDHKKAISEAHKGVPRLDLKGIPRSEATKKAISDAMKGVNAKKILQFTKSGELIKDWQSAYEAAHNLGIAQSSICSCCNGKRKYAGGYVWKYA